MEHLAQWLLTRFAFLPAKRVIVRRPTLGHTVEADSHEWLYNRHGIFRPIEACYGVAAPARAVAVITTGRGAPKR